LIKKHYSEVEAEPVYKANSTKTTIRWLISKKDVPTSFSTRRFEIEPGGQIGLHNHPEDHHFYVLQGEGKAIDANGNEISLKPGDVLYVPPNELHGFKNDGSEVFAFICVIPNL